MVAGKLLLELGHQTLLRRGGGAGSVGLPSKFCGICGLLVARQLLLQLGQEPFLLGSVFGSWKENKDHPQNQNYQQDRFCSNLSSHQTQSWIVQMLCQILIFRGAHKAIMEGLWTTNFVVKVAQFTKVLDIGTEMTWTSRHRWAYGSCDQFSSHVLMRHLYLSSMFLGVAQRTDTKRDRTTCSKYDE